MLRSRFLNGYPSIRHAILGITLSFLCMPVLAGEFRVVDFGADDGLAVEFIKGVDQDTLGFIWVATDRGLFRFDGVRFDPIREGLPSLYVTSFFHDDGGELYAVTDEGVVRIIQDVRTPGVVRIIPGATTPSDTALVYPKHGLVDRHGTLWISEQRGLVRWQRDGLRRYPFPEKDHAYDFLRTFIMMDAGVNGLYVLSLNGNLYRYNHRRDRYEEHHLPVPIGQVSCALKQGEDCFLVGGSNGIHELLLPDVSGRARLKQLVPNLDVSSLAHDETGRVYFGTWAHGLYHFDPEHPNATLERIDAFRYIKVNDLFQSEGNLWVSTDIGVSLVQKAHFNAISLSGLNTYIHDIKEAHDGTMYFCDGARIMRLPVLEANAPLDTVYMNGVTTLLQFQLLRNSIYISTIRGDLLRVRNGRPIDTIQLPVLGRPILTMVQDEDGNLWTTQSYVSGVCRIDASHTVTAFGPEAGLTDPIQAIGVVQGGMFASTVRDDTLQLFRFEEDRFRLAAYHPLFRAERQHEAFDLATHPEGGVLVATSAGLFLIRDGEIVEVDLDLQESKEVRAITVHPDGELWAGTRFGVVQRDKDNIIRFGISDGLPARTISRHSMLVDSRGYVWMGTSLGAVWTGDVASTRHTPVPVLLSARVDGVPAILPDDPRFSTSTLLELHYASLAYPGRFILYQQRLVRNGDEPWSESSGQRLAFLNRLQPGEYVWQVRAKRQSTSSWSEPLMVPFQVRVPWYASWWMFLGVLLVMLGLYVIAVRIYTRKLVREKERLEHLIGQRTRQALDQLERSKNAELEAQQMRTTNRIAGTIAHEFNNPLAIIQASLDLLKLKELRPEERKAFERIQNQVIRMSDLVRKLLRLQDLREMDYAAGMKILNIHGEEEEPSTKGNPEPK